MQPDIRQAIEGVFAIEKDAEGIVDKGAEEAKAIRRRAIEAGQAYRDEIIGAAHREAESLITSALALAEQDRENRMAEITVEIERMERSAAILREVAVRHVVASLCGTRVEAAEGLLSHSRSVHT